MTLIWAPAIRASSSVFIKLHKVLCYVVLTKVQDKAMQSKFNFSTLKCRRRGYEQASHLLGTLYMTSSHLLASVHSIKSKIKAGNITQGVLYPKLPRMKERRMPHYCAYKVWGIISKQALETVFFKKIERWKKAVYLSIAYQIGVLKRSIFVPSEGHANMQIKPMYVMHKHPGNST